MSDPIGVVVAEDDDLSRAALAELVDSAPGMAVRARARNGREAVAAVREHRPDVVLMDIRMPVLDGLAATRLVCDHHPGTRVVVLTTFDLDEYVYEALRAGASGFLLKNAPPEEILRAVRTARDGNAMLAPEVTRRMIAHVAPRHRTADRSRFRGLTERERDVVAAITRGLSNEEIAAELFLSKATVKTYLSRLFTRLGVRDRTQLVILVYESGYIAEIR
ncbi:response regulator transcription factor [Thermobifida alba]|uniref:Response regulator transcription factor n=1 Tax=Thermobifida alba TaxID=53522 RepID=A0ABY4L4J7_THEAE|nr:response regulator transcription factor [Thermobifida alba]UPT22602.1 response regulator transcription factor [Thermobifida alba]